jgi:hypothetical protein
MRNACIVQRLGEKIQILFRPDAPNVVDVQKLISGNPL